MRVLIVHKSVHRDVVEALNRSGITGLSVLVWDGRKTTRFEDDLAKVNDDGAYFASIKIRRRDRRTIESMAGTHCRIDPHPESAQGALEALKAWLGHSDAIPVTLSPAEAFRQAAERQPGMFLADRALDRADEIDPDFHGFANRAASALEASVRARQFPEGIRQFFRARGVNCVSGGKIRARCRVDDKGAVTEHEAKWHLKDGFVDPRPERVPRVYFVHLSGASAEPTVIVLYVGPHPSVDIEASASF